VEVLAGVAVAIIGLAVGGGVLRTRAVRRAQLATLRRSTGQRVDVVIGSHWSPLGRGRSFFDATLTLGEIQDRGRRTIVEVADVEVVEPAWDVYREEAPRLEDEGLPVDDLWTVVDHEGEVHVWQQTRSRPSTLPWRRSRGDGTGSAETRFGRSSR
jgi:hypothetical protein